MSTIKASNIQNGSSSSVNIALNTDGSATFAQMPVPTSSFLRNKLINGAMEINQRAAAVTSTNYTVDRWGYSATQTSKATVQQNAGSITPPVGFSSYLGVTSSSAYAVTGNDAFQLYQTIEGFNCVDFGWGTSSPKTATLSFWVYSSLTGTFGGSIATNKTTVWVMPFTYSIPVANTWTYVTVLVPAPASAAPNLNNQEGIFIRFGLGSAGTSSGGTAGTWTSAGNYIQPAGTVSVVGTNGATFYITGAQFEVGSVATPFERRLYTTELQLAQRYYFRIKSTGQDFYFCSSYNYSTTLALGLFVFPVQMRTAPTALEQSGTASDYWLSIVSGISSPTGVPAFNNGNIYNSSISLPVSGVTAGQGTIIRAATANAYLGWSAEL